MKVIAILVIFLGLFYVGYSYSLSGMKTVSEKQEAYKTLLMEVTK